jgi:rubrerythrin|tara:strand:- start:413 stop:760 length:348 start_codon:yes stop_codon:yes gene_type:complete
MKKIIRIGDEIEYERGNDTITRTARVIEISRVAHSANHYKMVLTEEKDIYEFTLDDHHWCFGFQILSVSEWFCPYCEEIFEDEDARDGCDCPGASEARSIDAAIEAADARRKGEG